MKNVAIGSNRFTSESNDGSDVSYTKDVPRLTERGINLPPGALQTLLYVHGIVPLGVADELPLDAL